MKSLRALSPIAKLTLKGQYALSSEYTLPNTQSVSKYYFVTFYAEPYNPPLFYQSEC